MERETHLERLRATMMRLAAELDGVRLHQSAAYISMAADSIVDLRSSSIRQAQDDPSTGSGRAGSGSGLPEAIDLDFTLDENGLVWLIRDGDCHRLGPGEPVCAEMRRFLAGVECGGDGYA